MEEERGKGEKTKVRNKQGRMEEEGRGKDERGEGGRREEEGRE